MSRLIAAAIALSLSGSASAGGYLAGSLQAAPTSAAGFGIGNPAVRVGVGNGSFAAFGSLTAARLKLDEADFTVWGAQPMLGVRGRVGKRPGEAMVNPLLTGGVYTRIFGLKSTGPDVEIPEQDGDAGLRPVVGGLIGTGLDARINANLSLSAEVGLDAFTAGYKYDDWVSQGQSLSTWSAVTLNLWL